MPLTEATPAASSSSGPRGAKRKRLDTKRAKRRLRKSADGRKKRRVQKDVERKRDEDEDLEDDEEDAEEDEEGEGSLLEQANDCLAEFPPRVARALELLEQALKAEPENPEVLDALGALLCEEGEPDRARSLLLASAKLRPDAGAEKFLCLAQLSTGAEALEHFGRGAAVLQSELEKTEASASSSSSSSSSPSKPAFSPLRAQLAGVHASMAELYMTDLCDEAQAEEACEAALIKGFAVDSKCFELLSTKATLRKVQGRLDEAREVTLEAAKIIKPSIGQGASSDAEEEAEGSDEEEGDEDENEEDGEEAAGKAAPPDEDAVAALCRIMIDLEQSTAARELLVGLLQRDEEDLRAWVLLGYCHIVEKDRETAQDCAKHGFRLCKKHGADAEDWKPELRKLLKKAQSLEANGSAPDGAEA